MNRWYALAAFSAVHVSACAFSPADDSSAPDAGDASNPDATLAGPDGAPAHDAAGDVARDVSRVDAADADDTPDAGDGGDETSLDAGSDVALDGASDSAADAQDDTRADGPGEGDADAAQDGPGDGAADDAPDTNGDGEADAEADAPSDGPDGGPDAATDATVDAPPDAPVDALDDATLGDGAVDADADASVDAGIDADGGAVPPVVGEVLIAEVMFNPSTPEPDTEWIELVNTATGARLLSGLTLQDGQARTALIASNPPITIGSGAYVLLARNTASAVAAGVPAAAVVYEYGAGLASNQGVLLANGVTGGISLWSGTTELANVPYGPWGMDRAGSSIELVTPVLAGSDQSSGWCIAATAWASGTDKGTPGAAGDCP
jgi:hypothetical protein